MKRLIYCRARLLRLTFLTLLFAALSGSTVTAQPVLGPGVWSSVQNAAPTEALTVVVTFRGESGLDPTVVDQIAGLGISQGIYFQSLPIAGLVVTPAQVQALADMDGVVSIWSNEELSYFNADARALTGVDKIRTDATMRNARGLPYSGKGIGIVIHDSGIDGTHPDLKFGSNLVENVQGLANPHAVDDLLPIVYAEGQPNTDLGSGHGTHVAGTVGGTGQQSGGQHAGVAPGADLIGYGSGAVLLILDTIGGFDYAITHQFDRDHAPIRIITNSWGSSGAFNPANPVNIASYLAYKRGITVLFAAGNSGPDEDTHNPYAQAPWVISVGAGTKAGNLVDFSSRGLRNDSGTFTHPIDNTVWTWDNEPSVVAPGVDIISTRATTGSLPFLEAERDVDVLGANAAFYTHMSGTSMATPHVAGITALLLEAVPTLQPDDIKDLLTSTATNMPGRERWEVGAGYVNAFAAMQAALGRRTFGTTLTATRDFNASVDLDIRNTPFVIDYNPRPELSADGNTMTFNVPAGLTVLAARLTAAGLAGETGNSIYPVLTAPDGTAYSAGTTLLFTLEYGRAQIVPSPMPGTWTLEIRGIQNGTGNNVVSFPEEVHGRITFETVNGFNGLSDIAGHPAAAAIEGAVAQQLLDGYADGTFRPGQNLTRIELAEYLVLGAGIRQGDGSVSFGDVPSAKRPYAEAVAMRGAALRDGQQKEPGVMSAQGAFQPNGAVSKADLAGSLIRSLGQSSVAESFQGAVTADYLGTRVPVTDVPPGSGYIQAAIDLGLLGVRFHLTQGPFDPEPIVTARFEPTAKVSRGDYAVAALRYFGQY